MIEIRKFTDSAFCLNDCRACCRFSDENWLPNLLEQEKKQLGVDRVRTIPAEEGQDACCEFLDRESQHCRIYSDRPFECRLYPFLLVRSGQTLALAVHLACPYLRRELGNKEFWQYVAYLRQELKVPETAGLLQREAGIFHVYPEIEIQYIEPDIFNPHV